jgi:membrane protease YdiL (CAAX protease family)
MVENFGGALRGLLVNGAFSGAAIVLIGLRVPAGTFPQFTALLTAAAAVALTSLGLWHWTSARRRQAPFIRLFSPRSAVEFRRWVVLATFVGVTEELTWRFAQVELLVNAFGSRPLAVALCTVTFGIGHLPQGPWWGLGAAVCALVFHALTWASGSIVPAMAVHAVVDIAAGVYFMRATTPT